MKKINLKKAMTIVLAAALALIPTFSVLAETAKEVNSEGGRAIIVQEVKLEDETAAASVTRGETTFAPAAGVRLGEGDVLCTEGKAILYLSVDSQMVLRLDYNTEAVIEKAAFGQKLVVNVQKGHMFYNVAKQASGTESLELMSNNITIAIRGTSGQLGSELGKLQHQLYDGVVEVSSYGMTIQQTPGQMIEVAAGPSGGMLGKLTVKEFTLADIPKSLVEEMKKDGNLMERILQSVPLTVGADGKPVYADAATFLESVPGKDDNEVFAGTSRQNIEEAAKEAAEEKKQQQSDPSSDPEPTPSPDPEPEPEPEPEPTMITCPGCGETVEEGDPDHAFTRYDCPNEEHGYYVCCGFDEEEAAKHYEHDAGDPFCQIPEHFEHYCETDEAWWKYHSAHGYACQDEEGNQVYACDSRWCRGCYTFEPDGAEDHNARECPNCGNMICDKMAAAELAKHESGACAGGSAPDQVPCPYCNEPVDNENAHVMRECSFCGETVYSCMSGEELTKHDNGTCAGGSDPDPTPTMITCPGCGETIEEGDAGHAKNVVYDCGKESHYDYQCCTNSAKAAEHATVTDEEGNPIGYACYQEVAGDCGVHKKLIDPDDADAIAAYKAAHALKESGDQYACGEWVN